MTLKGSKSKSKIRYYFNRKSAIILRAALYFLYVNVLNYRYFYTDCSTFLKIKTLEKYKKDVKTHFYGKIIKIRL